MKRLLYTGSFDPVTFGHLDIIRRAAKLADELFVGVGVNANKKPLFTTEERMKLLEKVTSTIPNIKIIRVEGLTADAAVALNAVLVRGIRDSGDLPREQQIYGMNRELDIGCETIYLMSEDMPFVSSSAVKEIWQLNANAFELSKFVPMEVVTALSQKRKELQRTSIEHNLPTMTTVSLADLDNWIQEVETERLNNIKAYQQYLKDLAADISVYPSEEIENINKELHQKSTNDKTI